MVEDGGLTLHNLFTLVMLILLQAVLGFDNLLYISMESKRVEKEKQPFVRRVGVGLAIVLRIILLFVLMTALPYFQKPFLVIEGNDLFTCKINVHSLIVLGGGAFIIYTAIKEIFHMLAPLEVGQSESDEKRSVNAAIFWIVMMNLIFSFDSILSALALTKVFWVMAAAILVSGAMMMFLADHVSTFLQKNRMYEVLGLFVLFIVGIMLVSEGGELAHLVFWGNPIHPMAKSTFYFVLAVLVVVDVVQGRYQKKLMAQKAAQAAAANEAAAPAPTPAT